MIAIQIHYSCEKITNNNLRKIRKGHLAGTDLIKIPLYFKIYTNTGLEDLDPLFFEWVDKTKIYTAPSLCRFLMKKDRSIKALSENQYLNLLLSKKKYKKYF